VICNDLDEIAYNMHKLEFPKPEGLWENIEAFFTAVDIHENFNRALIAFHLACFGLVIATKKRHNLQLVVFCLLLGICYFLENLNEYLAGNWKKYTSQNYFDKSGLFVCIMIGLPALCNCLLVMVFSMSNTFQSLTQLAALKLRSKKKSD
jgi:hypothetical protein